MKWPMGKERMISSTREMLESITPAMRANARFVNICIYIYIYTYVYIYSERKIHGYNARNDVEHYAHDARKREVRSIYIYIHIYIYIYI